MIAARAIADKIFQINQKGMSLLEATLTEHSDPAFDVHPHIIQNIFKELLARLGDNNTRLRERAESVLLQMAGHSLIGSTQVINLITKRPIEHDTGKSPKLAIGRLSLLHKILQRHPLSASDNYIELCLKFALGGFKHALNEVRIQSFHVILECYKSKGKAVMQSLTGLRGAQVDMLEKGFAEIEENKFALKPERKGFGSGKKAPRDSDKAGAVRKNESSPMTLEVPASAIQSTKRRSKKDRDGKFD